MKRIVERRKKMKRWRVYCIIRSFEKTHAWLWILKENGDVIAKLIVFDWTSQNFWKGKVRDK